MRNTDKNSLESAAAGRELPRRSLLSAVMATCSAWISGVLGFPIARFVLFPLSQSQSSAGWKDLGPLAQFSGLSEPARQQIAVEKMDGWQASIDPQTVYVLPGTEKPRVLSAVCPHLGCSVQWHAEKDRFICPCHGGTYANDGSRISGPPARGMDELDTRVEDGRVYVKPQYFRQLLATKEEVD